MSDPVGTFRLMITNRDDLHEHLPRKDETGRERIDDKPRQLLVPDNVPKAVTRIQLRPLEFPVVFFRNVFRKNENREKALPFRIFQNIRRKLNRFLRRHAFLLPCGLKTLQIVLMKENPQRHPEFCRRQGTEDRSHGFIVVFLLMLVHKEAQKLLRLPVLRKLCICRIDAHFLRGKCPLPSVALPRACICISFRTGLFGLFGKLFHEHLLLFFFLNLFLSAEQSHRYLPLQICVRPGRS